MTRVQACALLGITSRTADRLVTDGVLTPLAPRTRPLRFDGARLVRDFLAYRERRSTTLDLHAERAALARSQRERVDIDIARKRAELIDAAEIVRQGEQYTSAWRAAVLALSRRAVASGAIRAEQEPKVAALAAEILREIATWNVGKVSA